ncbi:hypothetical protein VTK73DRAFT_9695 [Phialemonium thermophilum]|uniref:TauD/TfdA-like domain-containing protein n=1 Tax=Phialemonium thermophilum TaxID=223376 RepID=A0ABR3W0W4_9PEZI
MATSLDSIAAASLRLDPSPEAPVSFEAFDLPTGNQRLLGPPHAAGTVTPLALRATTASGGREISLDAAIESVKHLQAQGGLLTQRLSQHGTLLFRGLPIHDALDFSRFAHAFGYRPHEIIGIVVNRPELAPNVALANEAPKEVLIYSHNESPQVPHAPEYIFFYGHQVPSRGGESPVSSSLELFRRAREEVPELVDALAAKGVRSRVVYKPHPQYAGGSTLLQAFGKDVVEGVDDEAERRRKMEAQIARYGRGKHTAWEWTDDDGALVVTHHLPAIRTQPGTGLPTLFTGLAAYHRSAQVNGGSRANATKITYGDGTPIPDEYLEKLAQITDEIRVLHKWERGDVLVYDNVIAQHGRQPWEGAQEDRVILASLFDGEIPGAYGDQDWAQVVQALP